VGERKDRHDVLERLDFRFTGSTGVGLSNISISDSFQKPKVLLKKLPKPESGLPPKPPFLRSPLGREFCFFDEVDRLNLHLLIDRFAHVVDRQSGDTDCGECLHFDSGFGICADSGSNVDAGFGGFKIYRHFGKGELMTEGN
jgi:hypothetical protein